MASNWLTYAVDHPQLGFSDDSLCASCSVRQTGLISIDRFLSSTALSVDVGFAVDLDTIDVVINAFLSISGLVSPPFWAVVYDLVHLEINFHPLFC